MEDEKKRGKSLLDYAIFSGFIIGILCVLGFTLLLFGEANKQYIEAVALVALGVIPVTSLFFAVTAFNKSRSYMRRLCVGMNFGNVFSIIVVNFAAIMWNIELTAHDKNLLTYGFVASLAIAFILILWESGTKKTETDIGNVLEEGYPPYIILDGKIVTCNEGTDDEKACYELSVVDYYNQNAKKKTIIVNVSNIDNSDSLKTNALLVHEGGRLKVFETPKLTDAYLKSRKEFKIG